MRRKRNGIYLTSFITAAALCIGLAWGTSSSLDANAAAKDVPTVDLRIIGTTDIHGQLNSKDYEQGVDYNIGGLARVFNLIKKTKEELPAENVITLDAGDTLYDYTTEYIFAEDQSEIQPIYKAMAMVGYDAITLGNHDFDYGYDYILRQLDVTGLRDFTVVSNVTDSKTGEYPFLEYMLISRNMETSTGEVVEVKVGIIGQTIPTLTSKTHSYKGILKTEDMVVNAKEKALKLKEMGADVIIALSHTGIGPEEPDLNFKNVAYALTQIPEIDVVVCGHEHNIFPTTDMTSAYYKLPGVDKRTYLINGKNVIMAGDRGRSIGVVDLTLAVTGEDTLEIVERKSDIRFVKNTPEEKSIADLFGKWEERFTKLSTNVLGTLEEGVVIHNYYGLLADNTAIQLLNDSKINYALRYLGTDGRDYKDYPVIAASTYESFGVDSIDDYIQIKDSITESDLAQIQSYNNYLYLYQITGKQIREWLEWSASAYETISHKNDWEDAIMSLLIKENGLPSLIREEWLNDPSNFYVFDGIDYEIDPSVDPRYDLSGNKISNNRRIKSITHKGQEVTDDMVFILATDKITKPSGANKGVEKQEVLKGFNRSQVHLATYIKQLSKTGSIVPHVDYNWKLVLPSQHKFILRIPYYGGNDFEKTLWFVDELGEFEQYRYYIASYPQEEKDTITPHMVIAPEKTNDTAKSFGVAVQVVDRSPIKEIRYVKGDYDLDSPIWVAANKVNFKFSVFSNDIYSVYAEDIYGNKTVKKINIDNINTNLMETPTVVTYTNRKSAISGKASPNSTIVFEAFTGVYETKVSVGGSYSYSLPGQPSGSEVIVYTKDEELGLESEHIVVPVKRTGPNQPLLYDINNVQGYLSGLTRDDDATVIAIVDNTVYVAENGGKELFQSNTEIYKPDYKIVEIEIVISETGNFIMYLPPQEAGKTIKVYNLDHIGRNSRVATTQVTEAGPNAPHVYEISNIEKSLAGYVPNSGGKIYDITLYLGGNIYTTKTDKKGNFSFSFEDQLYAGQTLTVFAMDTKNKEPRISYPVNVTVNDIEYYVRENSTNLTLDQVHSKSYYITGNYYDNYLVYLAISQGNGDNFQNKLYLVNPDSDGRFRFALEERLEEGARIYVMSRFANGKILLANKTVVQPVRPSVPSLVKDITNSDKTVLIQANKNCQVVLTIGDKIYETSDYQYDPATDQYIYTIAIDRALSNTAVTITATNSVGTSNAYQSKVTKVAPELPLVNEIRENDTMITGKIELFHPWKVKQESDAIQSMEAWAELTGEESTKSTDIIKEVPKEVTETQTRIYAQIGKKTYIGNIYSGGNYEIKIPKQKAGTTIKIWGSNIAGRGPMVKVKVKANLDME